MKSSVLVSFSVPTSFISPSTGTAPKSSLRALLPQTLSPPHLLIPQLGRQGLSTQFTHLDVYPGLAHFLPEAHLDPLFYSVFFLFPTRFIIETLDFY